MNVVNFIEPTVELSYRIAIIGSAPRQEDASEGKAFGGSLGALLGALLHSADIQRSACLVGYACQSVADRGAFQFSETSYQRTNGLEELKDALERYEPNICLLLGEYAYKCAGGKLKLGEARGGLFVCNEVTSPFFGLKCLPTFEPMDIVRQRSHMPLWGLDFRRARKFSEDKDLRLKERNFEIGLGASEVVQRIEGVKEGDTIALDIEGGGVSNISMLSFATSEYHVVHIAPGLYGGEEWKRVFDALKRMLENPRIFKCFQNAVYDVGCLAWQWKIIVCGVSYDTMIANWEIYPEMRKGLGVLASVWTTEPPYKTDRKTSDVNVFNEYNCKDSAVTFEIMVAQKKVMTDAMREHFEFNMDLLKPIMFMMLKGIRYDVKGGKEKLEGILEEQRELQAMIETHAGVPLNVNSPKQMVELLYGRMRFEKQFQKVKGRKTNKATCDVEALLKLHKQTQHPIIGLILKFRMLDGVRKQLVIKIGDDGRVRCSYNLVGTETGRLNCSESSFGQGTNLQTITKKNRNLYLADDGWEFFQCDLEGADGWTVAAWCNYFGNSRMLEDYRASSMVKPAKAIATMYLDGGKTDLAHMPSEELGKFIKGVELPEWLYFASKRVQHGTNYGLKPNTMSTILLKDSYKIYGTPIYVSVKDCEKLQNLYLARYPGVIAWQNRVQRELLRAKSLSCASGHVRRFFGNSTGVDTFKEALAQEPQANTTYATNLVLWKLWNSLDNRDSGGRLIVEPLHQVHDAVCGQWRVEDRGKAIDIVKKCFNNVLMIAEQPIMIPFEGNYGRSWGELENSF